MPHQKRAPLFDAATDVCNDFAAVLQQLLRLSVYARMEIYGIFGRRQCAVYAVSCAAFACGMGAHQAVVRTVRRLHHPFRLRRSSSFGLGLVCVGHCLGLLLHARPQRPPGFAAVRYLYGNCRVALAWRAAQFGLAVSAIFRCVFSLLPMRLYDGTPGAGARVKWRFYLIYPAQFILIPLLGMRLAP